MDVLKDINIVLNEAGKRLSDRFSLIPKLFLVFLITNLLLSLANSVLLNLVMLTRASILFGFLQALLNALAYSVMLYALSEVVLYKRLALDFSDFRINFRRYFPDVYFACFILWIGMRLLNLSLSSPIYLIVILVFSALPEAIYLTDASRMEVFAEALKFMKENFVLWIPIALIHVVFFFLFSFILTIPPLWLLGPTQIFQSIVFLFALALYYTFRGVVFDYLNGSNARKRKFMDAWK